MVDRLRGSYPDPTESIKLAFEVFKHLATLNAGSIVLIGTFLRGIFPNEDGTLLVGRCIKVLIAGSFVSFGISLALAAFVMFRYARILKDFLNAGLDTDQLTRAVDAAAGKVGFVSIWGGLSLALFTLGLFAFGGAVLLNLA
jgi:hypothetical protein